MESASRRGSDVARLQGPAAHDFERIDDAQGDERSEEAAECGLGSWRPTWLQPLASKKVFLVVQGLIGLLIMALNSYFIGTITTIEKRFRIPSATSGVIASATDAGYMISLLTLGYLGGRGHKPRYIASGACIAGLCCFLFAAPHVLYGAGVDARTFSLELGDHLGEGPANHSAVNVSNAAFHLCGQTIAEECVPEGGSFSLPIIIFVGANFLMGAGGAMYFTLSIAYLDDNTRKSKAPLMIALSLVIRMMGPSTGFAMASYALAHYVDPTLTPTITNKDPRWIGAWWMGYVVFGTALCVLAPGMVAFPRELPRALRRRRSLAGGSSSAPTRKSLQDFRALVGRLVRNRVYILNTLSSIFFIFGLSGLWNFMPKYVETLFQETASRASLITGFVGLVFSALGVLASGLLITRFRPRPRTLALWNVVTEAMDVLGYSSWAFLGCPAQLHGTPAADRSWNLMAPCNDGCNCGRELKYAPVCLAESSVTFYSPCYAGCSFTEIVNKTRIFRNCTCALEDEVVDGACIADCSDNFTTFLIMQCVLRFLQATGKTGNMLIQFRSVSEGDKPMSVAFMEFLICCLVYIPAPIVYGVILDSICLVWGETCGHSGNCWLYDGFLLRYVLNFTAAGCLACALVLDIGVWYYAEELNIYDYFKDPDDVTEKKTKQKFKKHEKSNYQDVLNAISS